MLKLVAKFRLNLLHIVKTVPFAALASCGFVDYENTLPGKFSGSLFVMWIDDGGSSGDGTFVYVPNPRDPLTFTRSADGTIQTIQPQMMYTDGGSIPRFAQVFEGFNPWGYAPAYMVHDWLFVAHQCNTDGLANAEEAKIAEMSFQESADIIAEAIKGLIEANRVKENDVSPQVISSTVAGPISRNYWEKEGACRVPRISDDDRKAAEAGIPGSSRRETGDIRTLDTGQTMPLRVGQVVDVIQF